MHFVYPLSRIIIIEIVSIIKFCSVHNCRVLSELGTILPETHSLADVKFGFGHIHKHKI